MNDTQTPEKLDWPDIRVLAFLGNGLSRHHHQGVMNEIQHCTKRGVRMTYVSFDERAEEWRQVSAGLTNFVVAASEKICFLMDGKRSWVAEDMIRTCGLAQEHQTIVGALCPQVGFGAGWTSDWGDINEEKAALLAEGKFKEAGLPVGTNDDRGHNVDRVDRNFLAVPRSVPEKLWSVLNVNGARFKAAMNEAIGVRDPALIHKLCMLSLSEVPFSDGTCMYDFFRPISFQGAKGGWQHLDSSFAFSERCLYCGIQPMINSHPIITNWGEHGYTFHDAQTPLDRTTGPKEG